MKTASVREVQHGLAAVLEQVERGEKVAVTKRGRVVAHIVPAQTKKPRPVWPDSTARMNRLLPGKRPPGRPASQIIREMREERF